MLSLIVGGIALRELGLKEASHQGKDGVYRVLPSTTQEEQFAEEKERKARTLLLMAVPKISSHVSWMDDANEI
ncbi:hypothetical protein Tco_1311726 [Tanacetum coccineum]